MIEPSPQPPTGPAPPTGTSRRWFLAGGAAVVLGAGAGVLAEVLNEDDAPSGPVAAPAALLAAFEAERELLADLAATTGGDRAVRRAIAQVRADHEAHLAALRKLLASITGLPVPRPASVDGQPRTRAKLRAAERAAADNAARHAAALAGPAAALLASISACEATHAELLR